MRREVAHFVSLLPIISPSDLIAAVPRDRAEVCVRYGDMRMLDTPMKSPGIEVHRFWHRRFRKDGAHVWLRRIVHRLFTVT